MVDNCVECSKTGTSTESQYMEFPEGMHHYFDEKVCSFHHWLLYVRPRRGWEDYLAFAKVEGAAVGYHITLPPDEMIRATIRGDAAPVIGSLVSNQVAQTSDSGQGQPPGSSDDQTTTQPPSSQS